VERLVMLHLIERREDEIVPLPALARFHLDPPAVRSRRAKPDGLDGLVADTQLELTT
jgi:hypothetical protein